jgi:hypothetical protein
MEVTVISICDLMDLLYPGYWTDQLYKNISWEESSEFVRRWCKTNGAHYYAREKVNFSKAEAVHEARNLGKRIVVVEDLS